MAGFLDDSSSANGHHLGSPWVDGEHAAASRHSRQRASRAVIHHFTLLVLLVAVGIVVVTALPTVDRILSGDPAATARRGIARTLWAKGYAVGPPEADRAHPALDGPAPAIGTRGRRPSRTIGDSPLGGLNLFEMLDPEATRSDGEKAVGSGAWAARDMVLQSRAARDSEPAVEVSRGQLLVVVKQDGDCLLLAFKEGNRLELGWGRRDQVLLFP
ncbi:MAG: hypothetical protein JRI68_05625 [Deltaproteobacteria bacterium]|nr:hypothetical protein [Deltaproteobacteria bacterium]